MSTSLIVDSELNKFKVSQLTEEERRHLEYRPEIAYKVDEVSYLENKTIQVLSNTTSQFEALIKDDFLSVTSLISISDYLVEAFSKVLVSIEEKLYSTKIVVNGEVITFEDYKNALTGPDTLDNESTIETWESYFGDVNGNIPAELYRDVLEVIEDWNYANLFINEAILGQIYGSTINSPNLEDIIKNENNLYIDVLNSESQLKEIQDEILDGLRQQFNVSELNGKFDRAKRKMNKKVRVLYSKSELTSIMRSKAENTLSLLVVIDRALSTKTNDAFQGDIYQSLYTLLEQTNVFGDDGVATKEEILVALKKIKALLKYSVDENNVISQELRGKMKTVTPNINKSVLNKRITQGVHFRNNIAHDTTGLLDFIDTDDNNKPFNAIASKLANSLVNSEELYKRRLADLYKMHELDASLRHNNVAVLTNKDATRNIYRVIDYLINHLDSSANKFSPSQLSKWLRTVVNSMDLN